MKASRLGMALIYKGRTFQALIAPKTNPVPLHSRHMNRGTTSRLAEEEPIDLNGTYWVKAFLGKAGS